MFLQYNLAREGEEGPTPRHWKRKRWRAGETQVVGHVAGTRCEPHRSELWKHIPLIAARPAWIKRKASSWRLNPPLASLPSTPATGTHGRTHACPLTPSGPVAQPALPAPAPIPALPGPQPAEATPQGWEAALSPRPNVAHPALPEESASRLPQPIWLSGESKAQDKPFQHPRLIPGPWPWPSSAHCGTSHSNLWAQKLSISR